MKKILLFVLLCLIAKATAQTPTDRPGSKDHPFVSRFPDAIIDDYLYRAFDPYRLPLGPKTEEKKDPEKFRDLEGKVTRIVYVVPADAGAFGVFKSYEKALLGAGYSQMYRCSKAECGLWFTRAFYLNNSSGVSQITTEQEYGVFTALKDGKDVYIAIYTMFNKYRNRCYARVEVVEVDLLPEDQVTASSIEKKLGEGGKAVLYNLYFDTNKAAVKPESQPALQAVADLLKQNPELNFYVVGHTDHTGTLEANLDLSQRRAQAVADALASQFAIDPQRLTAKGLAFLAPVATNATDAGKALNRRVELVPR